MKRGKPRNLTVVIYLKFKGARAKCKYGNKKFDEKASRLQIHLDDCKPYLALRQAGSTPSSSRSST